MALKIEDPEADRLAQELFELTGEPVSRAGGGAGAQLLRPAS